MFNLYNFLIYIFVTSFTPGPNNMMSMNNAIRFGFKKSFKFNLGIFAGFLVIIPICTVFSVTLEQIIPTIKLYMMILGAAYLLYLAWKTWKSSFDPEVKDKKGASFLSGMLLQYINPKLYLYSITSMSLFILPYFDSIPVLLLFAVLLAFVSFVSTVIWSLFGFAFCKVYAKNAKIVNAIMALLLVYCAVSLFLN